MNETIEKTGTFTQRGSSLPMRTIYKNLKIKWLNQDKKRTNKQLAELIGVTPQVASTYASGTDNRTPPFSAILKICEALNMEVVIRPNSILVRNIKK